MTLKGTSLVLEQANGKSNGSWAGALVVVDGALVVVITEPRAAVVTAAVDCTSGALVEIPNIGGAVVASFAGLIVVSITVSAGAVVNAKIVGAVAPLVGGKEVVAVSFGSDVELPNTGAAVVACVTGFGVVVSMSIVSGAVVKNAKIGCAVVSSAGGRVVVASTGSIVVNAAGVVVAAVGGSAVVPDSGSGVVAPCRTAHPSRMRSLTQARCTGVDHQPPGLSALATKAAHSAGCSSMQHNTSAVGSRHSSVTLHGGTVKHFFPYSNSSGQTALQASSGFSGSGVVSERGGKVISATGSGVVVATTAVAAVVLLLAPSSGTVVATAPGAAVVVNGTPGSAVVVSATTVAAVVLLIALSTGTVVATAPGAAVVVNGESVVSPRFAAHPSSMRASTIARSSGYDHGPPGLSTFATNAAHSSGCSSSMQQITAAVGSRHSSVSSEGDTWKQLSPYSSSPGHTAAQVSRAVGSPVGCVSSGALDGSAVVWISGAAVTPPKIGGCVAGAVVVGKGVVVSAIGTDVVVPAHPARLRSPTQARCSY
jgi:hypothetical protein